jgi:hypothetical protein
MQGWVPGTQNAVPQGVHQQRIHSREVSGSRAGTSRNPRVGTWQWLAGVCLTHWQGLAASRRVFRGTPVLVRPPTEDCNALPGGTERRRGSAARGGRCTDPMREGRCRDVGQGAGRGMGACHLIEAVLDRPRAEV